MMALPARLFDFDFTDSFERNAAADMLYDAGYVEAAASLRAGNPVVEHGGEVLWKPEDMGRHGMVIRNLTDECGSVVDPNSDDGILADVRVETFDMRVGWQNVTLYTWGYIDGNGFHLADDWWFDYQPAEDAAVAFVDNYHLNATRDARPYRFD